MTTTVGLISDTPGLLRPEVVDHLASVEMILHAGDNGKREVIEGLNAIAGVEASLHVPRTRAEVLPDRRRRTRGPDSVAALQRAVVATQRSGGVGGW